MILGCFSAERGPGKRYGAPLDATRYLWSNGVVEHSQWKETFRTQAHKSSISIMCIHASTVITGSSDAELKVWEVEGDNGKFSSVILPHNDLTVV